MLYVHDMILDVLGR